jgi:hypothetical protein
MIDFYLAQPFPASPGESFYLFPVAIAIAEWPDFNIECECRDSPVAGSAQFFKGNA